MYTFLKIANKTLSQIDLNYLSLVLTPLTTTATDRLIATALTATMGMLARILLSRFLCRVHGHHPG